MQGKRQGSRICAENPILSARSSTVLLKPMGRRQIEREAIVHLELLSIQGNSNNSVRHSQASIELLARSISGYGLQNAIRVRRVPGEHDTFRIVHGDRRYCAYTYLKACDTGGEQWDRIPAIIEDKDSPDLDPGKRLAEETIRHHAWTAECLLFAELKANGLNLNQMQEEFGVSSSAVRANVAVGECLVEVGLDSDSMCQLAGKLSRQNFIDHVVPLRTLLNGSQSHKGKKGFVAFSRTDYDYSAVEQCVELILQDKLSRKDLPGYSRTHRRGKQTHRPEPQRFEVISLRDRVSQGVGGLWNGITRIIPGSNNGDSRQTPFSGISLSSCVSLVLLVVLAIAAFRLVPAQETTSVVGAVKQEALSNKLHDNATRRELDRYRVRLESKFTEIFGTFKRQEDRIQRLESVSPKPVNPKKKSSPRSSIHRQGFQGRSSTVPTAEFPLCGFKEFETTGGAVRVSPRDSTTNLLLGCGWGFSRDPP